MVYRTWQPNDTGDMQPRSVALGVFDGVHLGHRAVISAARNCGFLANGTVPTVTVFSLSGVPKSDSRLITAEQEQKQAATLGVDEWLNVPFDSVRDLSPETFVRTVLHEQLHAVKVTCGYNFRFGKGGCGDAEALCALCAPLGIEVCVVPVVERDGEPVSSTAVREALGSGDAVRAISLLGRPYTVDFPVQGGNGLGSRWGVPTVNQPFPQGFVCPRFGVYASLVVLEGVQRLAITNIGKHPTVGNTDQPQAETYIFDYEGDLYGQTPSVQLIRFLREEQRFNTVEELKAQITKDIAAAKAVLNGESGNKAILFDFDDTLQHRPHAFLSTARELLKAYRPDLSEDERETYAQWMHEENHYGYVDYTVYSALVCEHCGLSVPPQHMLQEFRSRFPFHSELLPNAVEVLDELHRRGYRLGIITNGDAVQQNLKLDYAALRTHVDIALVGDAEQANKPNAEVFHRAAQRLCVSPHNCVFVGDYVPNDIVGAQNAGMTPLYIDVHGRNECPQGVDQITALSELLEKF